MSALHDQVAARWLADVLANPPGGADQYSVRCAAVVANSCRTIGTDILVGKHVVTNATRLGLSVPHIEVGLLALQQAGMLIDHDDGWSLATDGVPLHQIQMQFQRRARNRARIAYTTTSTTSRAAG